MEILQLQDYNISTKKAGYRGPTTYMEQEVAPWNHPTSVANIILNWLKHTYMFGVQILAPPGHGKTKLATVIAHHVHQLDPNFEITWAGAYEFTHQEGFFKGLAKKPQFIIFDDITGALKQMSGKEVEANFEALTKVRWYLDPAQGKIPVVIVTTSHYSKNMEKQIRAQLGMTIFCGFGIEEKSNIDTFADKNGRAYSVLDGYGKLYDQMFNEHEFYLRMPSGKKNKYLTDKPFRCACMLAYSNAQYILFSDQDVCEKCSKKDYKKFIEPELILDKIKTFLTNQRSDRGWEEALKQALIKRGYSRIMDKNGAAVLDFIEHDLLSEYTTDYEKLVDLFWSKHKHKAPPKKVYHRRKRAEQIKQELEKVAVRVPLEATVMDTSDFDPKDPFNEEHNDLDKEFDLEPETDDFSSNQINN